MEIRSLNDAVQAFHRTGMVMPSTFSKGEEMKHRDAILGIRSLSQKNIELRPCLQCPKTGKVSMETVCRTEKGFIPIDFELAQWLFEDKTFFHHIAKNAKIEMLEDFIILCNGSSIYRAKRLTRKPFFLFSTEENELLSDTVGAGYVGVLPKIYQLVYRIPNMPYSFPLAN